MIRLFRNVRKRIIDQKGALHRYLLYALGEIVLVMIGILAALQVNNWNEQVKETHEEKLLLEEVLSSLDLDKQILSEMLKRELVIIQAIDSIDNIFSNPNSYNPSTLENYLATAMVGERENFNISAFNVLVSKGIEKISDLSLRLDIVTYYNKTLPTTEQYSEDIYKEWEERIQPIIINNCTTFEWGQKFDLLNVDEFLRDIKILLTIKVKRNNHMALLGQAGIMFTEIEELIDSIEKFLNE